jgi:hypothetical protein
VVLKCIAKRRDERYQRFEDVEADLMRIADDLGTGNARFTCSVCGFLSTQRRSSVA